MKIPLAAMLMVIIAVTCSGCFKFTKLTVLNGLLAVEDFSMATPTLYKFGSIQKKNGAGVDIIHFQRDLDDPDPAEEAIPAPEPDRGVAEMEEDPE